MSEQVPGIKIICKNKKAKFNYHIEKKYEAGLVLQGTEVKSLRDGKGSLKDAYADIFKGEIFLQHFHVSEYTHGNRENHDPLRKKKLLLHKDEIEKLSAKIQQRGYTLVPTLAYFKNGKVKVELALGKGKTKGDKREAIKDRESKRQLDKVMKKHR